MWEEKNMKVKFNTKSEFGQRPAPHIEEENDKLIRLSFSTGSHEEILSISYEDDGMVVEINDDYIVD